MQPMGSPNSACAYHSFSVGKAHMFPTMSEVSNALVPGVEMMQMILQMICGTNRKISWNTLEHPDLTNIFQRGPVHQPVYIYIYIHIPYIIHISSIYYP